MRFEGKSVIVTGAASGIGRATARLFAQEGARVLVADWSESIEEVATAIRTEGGTAIAMRMDAGREEDVVAMIELAEREHGPVDVLYANAGILGGLESIFEAPVEQWTEVLRVSLIGPALAIKHAGARMARRGKGAIVCTASVAGLRSGAGSVAYSASKAGVINLVQVSAQQLSGSGVRVNAICPGLIETGMTQMVYDHARAVGKEDRIGNLNPLRRGGEPEEIGRVALFLASDDASYVNGQAIAVDGGLSSSHPVTRQEFGRTAG